MDDREKTQWKEQRAWDQGESAHQDWEGAAGEIKGKLVKRRVMEDNRRECFNKKLVSNAAKKSVMMRDEKNRWPLFSIWWTLATLARGHCVSQGIQVGVSESLWMDFLVVQWLRICASNAEGASSTPDQGTRSHMPQLKISQVQWWLTVHVLQIRSGSAKYIHIFF